MKPIVRIEEISKKWYHCPVCNRRFANEQAATNCMNGCKDEPHRFKVGDVVKSVWYPGDYGETIYTKIKSRGYDDAAHKQGPYYMLDKAGKCYDKEKFVSLHMTKDELVENRQELQDMAKRANPDWDPDDGPDCENWWGTHSYEIEFDYDTGNNKLTITRT